MHIEYWLNGTYYGYRAKVCIERAPAGNYRATIEAARSLTITGLRSAEPLIEALSGREAVSVERGFGAGYKPDKFILSDSYVWIGDSIKVRYIEGGVGHLLTLHPESSYESIALYLPKRVQILVNQGESK